MLQGLTGRSIGDVAEWLASYPPLPFDQFEYYVTILLDREVDLPRSCDISPDLIAPPPPLWINPFALEELDGKVRAAASLAFDGIAARLSMILGAIFFRTRVHDGDSVLFRSGDLPLFYPRFTTSATGSVGRSLASFPTNAIHDGLADLAKLNTREHRWLMRPIQWYAAALTMEDRWRRFQAVSSRSKR